MKPCLILFDIDETLYFNEQRQIPNSTMVAISKLKLAGHTLAIATGRSPSELMTVIKELPVDFFIMSNGQLVLKDNKIIYENPIDKELIKEILTQANSTGVHLGFSTINNSVVTGLTPQMAKNFAKYYDNIPTVIDDIESLDSVYQMWYLNDDLERISESFKDRLRFLPWTSDGSDVVSTGASKAVGLQQVLAILPDLPRQVVFFGDGHNDIDLMESASLGIAMGNAVDPLKAIADYVTSDINNNGIYSACDFLGLFSNDSESEQLATAIINLKQQIIDNPLYLNNYLHLKELYSGFTRNSLKAIQTLKSALIHFPENDLLLFEIGAVYEFELADYDLAKKYYELTLIHNPDHQLATDALAALKLKVFKQ